MKRLDSGACACPPVISQIFNYKETQALPDIPSSLSLSGRSEQNIAMSSNKTIVLASTPREILCNITCHISRNDAICFGLTHHFFHQFIRACTNNVRLTDLCPRTITYEGFGRPAAPPFLTDDRSDSSVQSDSSRNARTLRENYEADDMFEEFAAQMSRLPTPRQLLMWRLRDADMMRGYSLCGMSADVFLKREREGQACRICLEETKEASRAMCEFMTGPAWRLTYMG